MRNLLLLGVAIMTVPSCASMRTVPENEREFQFIEQIKGVSAVEGYVI